MEHHYLKNIDQRPLPDFDAEISAWLSKQEEGINSNSYRIVICNGNRFYRSIICSGLGEFVQACEFLRRLNLENVLEGGQTIQGYDAVFVTLELYNKALSTLK